MYSLILKNKLLIVILLLGALLRFYKLTSYPIHLNPDEVTQLYDAISIAQTGKDIYNNFLPFIFPSVGDFKPPFYTYITSVFYFLTGWSELTVRLPGAIFSFFIIPAIYSFVRRLLKNKSIALLAAFFTSVAPFEIYFARKSFESGTGIFFILIGFLCLFKYFENRLKIKWLYFASAIFAAGMYTYFSHAIIAPLLITVFIIIYRKNFSDRFSRYILPLLLFIALISPLILMIFVNSNVRYRSQTVFVGQDRALGDLLEIGKSNGLIGNFFSQQNIKLSYIWDRYLYQFDPIYLFANGLDLTNQGYFGSGLLLLIQLPFIILGIIYLIMNKDLEKEKKFMLAWILVGMIPSALTFEIHSPHRVVMVFTMINVICAAGFYLFLKIISQNKKYFSFALGVTFLAFVFNIAYFIHIYFINYPFEKSEYLNYPFKQIAQFVWSQYPNYDLIVFDPQFGDINPMIGVGSQYYFGFYGHYPPAKIQKEFHIGSNEREVIFNKFSIRHVYWPADKDKKKTLFIVSIWSVPLNTVDPKLIIKRFNFYNGRLAFYAIKL